MAKLTELRIGERGIIKTINIKDSQKLMAMGLIPGTQIKLLRIAPAGDPLEFELKNYALSLRKETFELPTLKRVGFLVHRQQHSS